MNNLATSNDSQLGVTIQKFTPEYSDAIGELISKIQREEFEIPITLEQQPDLADISNFYQTGKGNFWIAINNQRVIGTIALLDIGNNQVTLRKMFVHSDYRGSHFRTAYKLLKYAFDWCRTEDVSEIYLGTTAQFLAAHRFYEKNGFTEISKEILPEKFPIMAVDTKFYMIKI